MVIILSLYCLYFSNIVYAKDFGTALEITIGQLVAGDIEKQFGISENPEWNAAVQNIALRLAPLATREGINYQFRVLNSDEVNACAVMGGYVYINKGLLKALGFASNEFDPLALLRQIFGGGGMPLDPIAPAHDELAFIIAHEISHIKYKHGVNQALMGLGLSVLLGGQPDSQSKSKVAAQVLGQILVSGRSRSDEKEADLKGVELMQKAGYDPFKALAVMRRIETLSSKEKELGIQGMLNRLMATHPPTSERCEYLKDYAIKSVTGFTFKTDVALAASGKCSKTWAPDDPGWVAAFEADTQRKVINLDKANKTYGSKNIGQCTWFVTAVREDDIARVFAGNAYLWYDRFQKANYGVGEIPKVGSIAVWGKNLPNSGGYGHVALVTKVNQGGTFTVWDSNWCMSERVGYHPVYNRDYLTGFIYWPNGAAEPPGGITTPPEVGAPSQPRDNIEIEKDTHHLGDEKADSKTIWYKQFVLNAADLAERTKAKIKLRVKGTPRKDPVISINRHKIGYAMTQTGEWEWFEFPFDIKILQAGNNLIDIETVIANLWQTFDECEFADVYLLLE